MLLLFVMTLQAQNTTITYTVSNDVITNPERGFFHALDTGTSSVNYDLLSQSELSNFRLQENVSVIIREFWLNDFINTNTISQSYLNNMQTDFNRLRASGTKAIIRFGYSKSKTNNLQQATKANILAHIIQLTPIINQNKDVIVSIQAGFIGTWGEWYYTGNSTEFGEEDTISTTQWNNRNDVLTALETNFHFDVPLQVRYINILQRLRPNGTDRIGIYNDAFLDDWCDSGTLPCPGGEFGTPTQANQQYLINLTTNLPMTGETDDFLRDDGSEIPRTSCTNALLECDKYNWSLLNTDYHQAVIANWQADGCYSELQKRLGYRYELINSILTPQNVLTINVKNTGYANVFKTRGAHIVLRNITTSQDYVFPLDTNLMNWVTNQTITIVQDLNYNVPSGQYKLYLSLSDPMNSSIPYSIRCANLDTWLSTSGYNDLNQTVTIDNLGIKVFVVNNTINIMNFSGKYTIKIYNLDGRLVKKNTLDVSGLKQGYYIVKLVTKDNTYIQKIYIP